MDRTADEEIPPLDWGPPAYQARVLSLIRKGGQMFKFLKSAVGDGINKVSGKTDVLEAGFALAARVAAADGKIEDDEIVAAVEAAQSIDSLKTSFTPSQIEEAASKQFARAKSILGRNQLKRELEDVASHDLATRVDVFMIGAMAAEAVGGIGPEERTALEQGGKILGIPNVLELLNA